MSESIPPLSTTRVDEMNIVERGGTRYYLFPNELDWYFQDARAPRWSGLTPAPRSVSYDFARNPFDHLLVCITNRCNIVCDYCFRGFNMGLKPELSFEDIKRVADHFLKHAQHKPTFQFTGGEVFVHKDIEKIFAYLHERDFRIWMTTNGVSEQVRTSKVVREIFTDNPKAHVRVSCDGHTPDLYERHRGGPGTFKKVEKNLRYLVGIGCPVSIKTVVTPENIDYVEEIIEWAYELGLSGWNYNVLRYTGALAEKPPEHSTAKLRGARPEYVGYRELGRRLLRLVTEKPHLTPLLGISRFGKIIDTLYGPNPHGVRMVYYVLNWDGAVYPNDNLMVPEYRLGNIYEDGMDAFSELQSLHEELDRDLPCCKKCPIHRFCFQKGDYGEAYLKDPTLTTEFPNCNDIREHFLDVMDLKSDGLAVYENMRSPTPLY